MLVYLGGAYVGRSLHRSRVREPVLRDLVRMRVAVVDQGTMLGTPRVLDQQHVAAIRGLQEQPQDAGEDASAPNHWGSRKCWARRTHRLRASNAHSTQRSSGRPCALEWLTQRGYTLRLSRALPSNGPWGPHR